MALPRTTNMYRLTREPELTFSQSGVAVCRVGLACSEKYGEKETQLFIDATAFKKTAELLATVNKGHRVFVFGKLETQTWPDHQTGQNRSKICMVIENFEFVEPKQQSQQPQNNGYNQPPQQQYQQNNSGSFQQPMSYQNSNNHQDFGQHQQDEIPFSCNIV